MMFFIMRGIVLSFNKDGTMTRRNKSKPDFLASKYNRYAVITLEVAGLLSLVIITCAVLRGDIFNTFTPETTKYVLQYQPTEASTENDGYIYNSSDANDNNVTSNNQVQQGDVLSGDINSIFGGNKPDNVPDNQGGAHSVKLPSPAGWSKSDIVAKAKSAVNKTQGYRKRVNVHHKEAFEATVTECTGGSIVKTIANTMVGWIVKPVDESLSFTNGRATNSEGENIPLILPKKGSFNLSPSGVSSASAKVAGNEYVIKLNLIGESVGIGEVPTHNASAIGFLDVANFDISFMEIDRADITYSGSSIELHINSEGYVTYAVYKIPLEVSGSAHRGSISGSAEFTGEQSEIWTINY